MWIQTLPNAVQARILSFLLYDSRRFCESDLRQLAETMLKECKELDFWVKRAAHQLLDVVSRSNHEWLTSLNLDSEEELVDDEFSSLPNWLKDAANDSDLMLPWLPISQKQFNLAMQFSSCGENDDPLSEFEEGKRQLMDDVMEEVDEVIEEVDDYLNPQVEEMAGRLKDRLLSLQSTAKAVELAGEIRQLCTGGGKSLAVLSIIEPWRADDETAAVLMSNLLVTNEATIMNPNLLLPFLPRRTRKKQVFIPPHGELGLVSECKKKNWKGEKISRWERCYKGTMYFCSLHNLYYTSFSWGEMPDQLIWIYSEGHCS